MQPVQCATCGNKVLAEKFSPSHTSVQWLDDAESACPEFARRAALGEPSGSIPTCPALRDSIENAVRAGTLATDGLRHEPVPGRLG
ncbi:hypothetical protein [Nocardia sp. AG03]|uniref:hypothetical protein n=1 Tax=Nocardia sp. AG03 TaxID=3025312 RepID=UPI002418B3CE|nr:hypothetical protein [Nocardia sp. AG03]